VRLCHFEMLEQQRPGGKVIRAVTRNHGAILRVPRIVFSRARADSQARHVSAAREARVARVLQPDGDFLDFKDLLQE
jgi:hypothetical protein